MWRRRFAVAWIGEYNHLSHFFLAVLTLSWQCAPQTWHFYGANIRSSPKKISTLFLLFSYSLFENCLQIHVVFQFLFHFLRIRTDFHANVEDLWFYLNGFSGTARNFLKYLEKCVCAECGWLNAENCMTIFVTKHTYGANVRWTHESYCLISHISPEKKQTNNKEWPVRTLNLWHFLFRESCMGFFSLAKSPSF